MGSQPQDVLQHPHPPPGPPDHDRALPASPDDPCYQKDVNCFMESQSEIGHFGFLPDIWACEFACRDEPACKWFTWYKQDGFYMCYLLGDCDRPRHDDLSISGEISQCTPDTTPTARPPWTPPHQA